MRRIARRGGLEVMEEVEIVLDHMAGQAHGLARRLENPPKDPAEMLRFLELVGRRLKVMETDVAEARDYLYELEG